MAARALPLDLQHVTPHPIINISLIINCINYKVIETKFNHRLLSIHKKKENKIKFLNSTESFTILSIRNLNFKAIMSSCSNSLLTLTASAKSTRTRRKLLMYTKLISLYKSYECLWMENHANFFNFALKGEIWDAIAEKMLLLTPRDQEPNPEKWKSLVHTLRYKMELEKVNEEKAKYFKEPYLPPKRKLYTEKLKFVSTHRFDRKAQTDSVPTVSNAVRHYNRA